MQRTIIFTLTLLLLSFPLWVSASTELYIGLDNCSDSGSGNMDQPFCSFEHALSQLQPGDILTIQAGIYPQRVIVEGVQGLPEAPITIRGESATSVIFEGGCKTFPCDITVFNWEFAEWEIDGWDISWELDGFISIRNSHHIVLQDLTVQHVAMEGIHIENSNHVVINNVFVEGTGNGGIVVNGSHNVTISNNNLHNVQLGYIDKNGESHIGYHEALSIIASHEFEVANNSLSAILKEGIDVKESSSNGRVYGNVLEYICSVGIYINEAHDILVYENVIQHIGFWLLDSNQITCSNHPKFGLAFDDFFGTGILLAVGDLGDVSRGQLSNIAFYQNVVADTREDCIQFWDELRQSGKGQGIMTDVQIYNNTLVNCGLAGIRIDDAEAVTIANNIIALTDDEVITGNATAISNIWNNLYQLRFDWQTTLGNDFLVGDPLFVDAINGNFCLQANSPAIDAGRDMDLPYSGNAPDIGTLEYECP